MSDGQRDDDVAEITRLLHAYARAVADRRAERMAELFTDDAVIDFGGAQGRQTDVAGYFRGALGSAEEMAARFGLDQFTGTTPIVSGVEVDVDGDAASARSFAVAIHAGSRGGAGVLLVRGVENLDRLRRTTTGWRLAERHHRTLWSTELPAVVAGD